MIAKPIRVLVVDRHQTFAELLGVALGGQPDLDFVGHAPTGADAVRLVAEARPDVVLMDAQLPDVDGVAFAERLRADDPGTRVVMLTAVDEPTLLRRATAAGASGFLAKDGALGDVLRAVRTAHGGGMTVSSHLLTTLLRSADVDDDPQATVDTSYGGLTPREREVLLLMGAGLDTRTVARRLGISVHTCRGHTRSVLAKLDAHSQLEAVAVAARHGLLDHRH